MKLKTNKNLRIKKKIIRIKITALTLLVFIGYSCENDERILESSENIEFHQTKLTEKEAKKALEEMALSNDWTIIKEGKNNEEIFERNINNQLELPGSKAMNLAELRGLGLTNNELIQETRRWSQSSWGVHSVWYEPYAIFFDGEDALNNTHGYSPIYATSGSNRLFLHLEEPVVTLRNHVPKQKDVHEFVVTNLGNTSDTATYTYSYEEGMQQEVSVSVGVSVGFEGTVKVPLLAEAKFSVGVEINSGYTNTKNTLETISAQYTAQLPPRSKRIIRIITDMTSIDATYHIPYRVKGDYEAYYYYNLSETNAPFGELNRNLLNVRDLNKYLENKGSIGSISYLRKSNIQVIASDPIKLESN
ncbi:hypothetical protein CXF68_04310 [Tenacibaculum sp. Bg11-29]|uniref:aerolysin family beta-barrel pore-forming toxin n=1 Tax=Tenacibaculum sp. Bg11-29 TaxID=2058306 RepID=UPI000C334924|nr:aerolysin family beta-barrel pore-forming toxin [Tenacibaculum sp. Bg11-29]PKH49972.1 hypothetical protein CXF68_04310 [Tenacibaculum sp. Bg11-29]